MGLSPSGEAYGAVAMALHWVMAVLICGLFLLGEYMTGLDYYHPWYHSAPALHKSIGLVVAAMLVVRLVWRVFWHIKGAWPAPVEMPRWERLAAGAVHRIFYLLLFVVVVCGYLVPTAEGRGVEFFGLFEVPALVYGHDAQEDAAGAVHELAAWAVVGFAALHAAAAVKHHFMDGDDTLMRMLGLGRKH